MTISELKGIAVQIVLFNGDECINDHPDHNWAKHGDDAGHW